MQNIDIKLTINGEINDVLSAFERECADRNKVTKRLNADP